MGGREEKGYVNVVVADLPDVRKARAHVRACCQEHGIRADAVDTAVLLTSEVVTNALTHGRSEARVTVTVVAPTVHVEVGDDNSRHPHVVGADENALDGRGVTILTRLATAWGIRDDEYGKTVWFDVTAE